MASGGCKDAFVALMECVTAAVKDGSGRRTATQPLPCLDAENSLNKCMEENASNYAHTLDLMASVSGAGEGRLVSELMKMHETALKVQNAAAEMEFCKVCNDACKAIEECVAAGGMTARTGWLRCLEAVASLEKCKEEEEEHCYAYFHMLNRIAACAGAGEVGVTAMVAAMVAFSLFIGQQPKSLCDGVAFAFRRTSKTLRTC